MNDQPIETQALETQNSKLAVSANPWLRQDEMKYLTRYAEFISNSDLLPVSFKGKPANIMLALQFAARMNIDPMVAMQGIFIYKGKPGLHAQLAISLANESGLFSQRIAYEFSGTNDSNLEVRAYAPLRANGKIAEGYASMAMAVAEGWTANSKYKSMPRQMLSYRAATSLIRLYAPEIMSGLPISEEIEVINVEGQPEAGGRMREKMGIKRG